MENQNGKTMKEEDENKSAEIIYTANMLIGDRRLNGNYDAVL